MSRLQELNRMAFELLTMSNAVQDCATKLEKVISGDVDLKQIKADMKRTKAQIYGIQAEVDERLNGGSK